MSERVSERVRERTAMHPMHMDEDEHTRRQVQRLKTELPKQ